MVRESNSRSAALAGPRLVRRQADRRNLILRAAARMFRQRGFADTGMRDIAGAADLSAANLYHYFRGKEEILFYCQDRALDRMLAAVVAARKASARATGRLRSVLETHLRILLDEVEGATAHLQVDALSPVLRARIVTKRDRYERAVRRLITEGMDAGDFVRTDAALVARGMLGALNWTVTWFRPDGPDPAETVARTLADFLVRGVSGGTTIRSPHAKRA